MPANAKGRPLGRPFVWCLRSEYYFFLPFFAFLAAFFLAGFLAALFMAMARSSKFQVPVRELWIGTIIGISFHL